MLIANGVNRRRCGSSISAGRRQIPMLRCIIGSSTTQGRRYYWLMQGEWVTRFHDAEIGFCNHTACANTGFVFKYGGDNERPPFLPLTGIPMSEAPLLNAEKP